MIHHQSLWLHGNSGIGKTQSIAQLMHFLGYINPTHHPITSPTPPAPLPPLLDGLIYPRDKEQLNFLSRYHNDAIRALGQSMDIDRAEREQRFDYLRRIARDHSRADREVIESIIIFDRMPNMNGDAILAAVKHSLIATAVAEKAALEAAETQAMAEAALADSRSVGVSPTESDAATPQVPKDLESHARNAAAALGRSFESVLANINTLINHVNPDAVKHTTTPAPLPPLLDGLIYPRDKEQLNFLSRYHNDAIRALGRSMDIDRAEREQRFDYLRRIARDHSRTDREVIESIIIFSRMLNMNGDAILAAVKHSLSATAVAEKAALEAAETSRSVGVSPTATETSIPESLPPGKAFSPTSAIQAISLLLTGDRPNILERIHSVIERTAMDH